jgi:hypothetical protein
LRIKDKIILSSLFLLALQFVVDLSLFQNCRSIRFPILEASQQNIFHGVGFNPHAQPRTWRARVSLFVWVITLDLFGLEGLTISYVNASVAVGIIGPRQPYCFFEVWDILPAPEKKM